ncbi:hypothetical protein DFH94DRAFT_795794 [Russula ochroleuca]|uniref:Uncharacterized protein n=1 Tax=Russula ochroleuca TaxID=152965 RepID=A0A9P5JXW9_9AGAM|nr:hypothetical protein DFH94DRAFT_795794 [Russula ochroleuca]
MHLLALAKSHISDITRPKSSTGKRNKGHSRKYSKAILKAAIKVKNCQKQSASKSESTESRNDSSDEEPRTSRVRKKVKQAIDIDEEVKNEQEEVEVEETTKDLLMIFSDLVVVKFKMKETYETVKGRWCLPCKICEKNMESRRPSAQVEIQVVACIYKFTMSCINNSAKMGIYLRTTIILSTADGWTANNTKASCLGMTAHWIDVDKGKWRMHSEVVGFQGVSGEHSGWNLGCLEHIVNLANIAVMGHITKIAAVENATAIWEYDLDLPNNCLLGGSLDVIAAVCTIAIKIQASGQHIEYFEKLQLNCKVDVPLRIPLHSNVRWDALYGPITTVCRNGQTVKKIPWNAFQLTDADWERVKDV